ncbi:CHASE 2 domain-containing and DUF4145 [Desulfonema limicola]|uniref:CHASE 2 domain-containing and DUF4145 n=1 Tax=Desulfonema limicola TaxID=45656 RepID=A0A975B524_9BACT|nr:CHASE2 domain-containing protein [Desulfonema limicola]QTA78946.1 CHASE 2 domain-containing and DUF4145 [Desulfonema limicola]
MPDKEENTNNQDHNFIEFEDRDIERLQNLAIELYNETARFFKNKEIIPTLQYARQVLETIIKLTYLEKESRSLPKKFKLAATIGSLNKKKIFPEHIRKDIEIIQDYGNRASHPGLSWLVAGDTIRETDMFKSASHLNSLMQHYFNTYYPKINSRINYITIGRVDILKGYPLKIMLKILWIFCFFFLFILLNIPFEHIFYSGLTNLTANLNLKKDSFSKDIAIITLDEKQYDKNDKNRRENYARLIRYLADAKAKVIVFDMVLSGHSDYDLELINAVEYAKKKGTHTLFVLTGKENYIEDKFTDAGFEADFACYTESRFGHVVKIPVRVIKDGFKIQYSIAFNAVKLYIGGKINPKDDILEIIPKNEKKNIRVQLLEPEIIRIPGNCAAIEKDDKIYEILIRISSTNTLRDNNRHFNYSDIYNEDIKQPEADKLKARFNKKIVIAGGKPDGEDFFWIWERWKEKKRYGMELQADAVNALLQETYIRSLSRQSRIIIIFLFFISGFALSLLSFKCPDILISAILPALAVLFCFIAFINYNWLINALYYYIVFITPYLMHKRIYD